MSEGNGKRKIERLDTLIGQQTEMRGDLLFTGGLHIDGNVKGDIVALNDGASSLVVSERGSVEGQIRAPHVTVNGMVIGDVYAIESVELASRARITGNVYYRRLEVAMGAEVNGSLIHLDEAGLPPSAPGQEIASPPADDSAGNVD